MPEDLWTTTRGTSLRLRAYDAAETARPGPSAIVALHGLVAGADGIVEACTGEDPFAWLASSGCHVAALDWPGHGRSGGRRGQLGYRLAMDAAAAAVDVVRTRWDAPVVLFGFGLGGILAPYAAVEDRRVAAVVAAGPLDLRDVAPALGRSRRAVGLSLLGRPAARMPPRLSRRLRVPWSALLSGPELCDDPVRRRRLLRHRQSVRHIGLDGLVSTFARPEDKPDVRALAVPLLALVGAEDAVVPEPTVRALAESVGEHAHVHAVGGAGHDLLIGHRRTVLPIVREFVSAAVA